MLLFTAACDPGARFEQVGSHRPEASWQVSRDTVHGRVRASAFTISLSVDATLGMPSNVSVVTDSATLQIRDVDGVELPIESFGLGCPGSIASARGRTTRCVRGSANLHSTNYDRLDSITVRFGYAVANGHRIPLITRFARVK